MVFPKSENSQSKEFIVTELLTELASVLNDKIKLESNYSVLKMECAELKQKLKSFKEILYEERTLFLSEYKKSQYDLYSKDECLRKKDLDNINNQEKYLSEVYSLTFYPHTKISKIYS